MPATKNLLTGMVILAALTIIIGITFVQWIVSWTSTLFAGQLQILHDSYIDTRGKTLYLRIRNLGDVPVAIQTVEIVGFEKIDSFTRFGREAYMPPIIVNPKTERVASIALTKDYISGVLYQVKVYTSTGNVYTAIIQAE